MVAAEFRVPTINVKQTFIIIFKVNFTFRCSLFSLYGAQTTPKPADSWTGRWLPERPTVPPAIHDPNHGVKMGVSSEACDNGKVNFNNILYV